MTKDSLAGKIVGGCTLIRELGRGNNGVVYLAKHEKLNKLMACKIISPEFEDDPDFMDNLFDEASKAAQISHPNIIRALDAGTDESGLKYFTMEYVDGSSLEDIRANNPEMISVSFLMDVAVQMAEAMDFVWRNHRMIHGDIKPGNMMICRNSRQLKIGDLGVANGGENCDPEDVLITPMYVAPEIVTRQNKSPDPRSDIYSFGVMLYELACGTAPFSGSVEELLQAHVNAEPRKLIMMNPDLDRKFADFVDSMLAKDPANRPADWQVVKNCLQEMKNKFSEVKTVIEKPVPPQDSVKKRSASWSAEEQKKNKGKNKFLEKCPWLIPTLLILVILGALMTIPFTMGFFK